MPIKAVVTTDPVVPPELQCLPATVLRVKTRDLMERVKFRGERFMIETFGRPMVVLISYEDYLCIRKHLPLFAADSSAPSTPPAADSDAEVAPL